MQQSKSDDNYVALDISTQQQKDSQKAQKTQNITNQRNTNNGKSQLRNTNFLDRQIRAQFVLKLFMCLSMELIFTFFQVVLGLYTNMQFWLVSTGVNEICYCSFGNSKNCGCTYIGRFYPTWLFYVSITVSLLSHIILICLTQKIRKYPWNLIILGLYLVFFGFLITNICILIAYEFGVGIVWQAMGLTLSFVFAFAVYIYKTKVSIQYRVGSICIFVPTIVVMIILMGVYPSYALSIFLCILFIIFEGYFLIWETKMIIGDGKLKLSMDDYAIGSLLLYASIIQLLWRIMRWIDAIKERKIGQEIANEYMVHHSWKQEKKERE